jgi:diadenosine tetraphosphate (Ap4A) HIT family hydrolase/predicted house-cleaning noncanonical NTP pyrophosphatase (MazG superfamily)
MTTKKIYKGKLVRDNISDIMKAQGLTIHERQITEESYIHSLKEKLLEEAMEVQKSLNSSELLEELADVFEVLYALIKTSGLTVQEVEDVRLKKSLHKGKFENRTYLDSIEIEDSNPFLHQYQHKNIDPNCIFCKLGQEGEVLAHFKRCYVIKDRYPVSPGHLLIIPYEHTLNWFTASLEVQLDILHVLSLMKKSSDEQYRPEGYNIGINCGETAGQSIMHLHVHLIPRYKGDMDIPKGGVRGVIPSKQSY